MPDLTRKLYTAAVKHWLSDDKFSVLDPALTRTNPSQVPSLRGVHASGDGADGGGAEGGSGRGRGGGRGRGRARRPGRAGGGAEGGSSATAGKPGGGRRVGAGATREARELRDPKAYYGSGSRTRERDTMAAPTTPHKLLCELLQLSGELSFQLHTVCTACSRTHAEHAFNTSNSASAQPEPGAALLYAALRADSKHCPFARRVRRAQGPRAPRHTARSVARHRLPTTRSAPSSSFVRVYRRRRSRRPSPSSPRRTPAALPLPPMPSAGAARAAVAKLAATVGTQAEAREKTVEVVMEAAEKEVRMLCVVKEAERAGVAS